MKKQTIKNYAFLTAAIALVAVTITGVVSAAPNLQSDNQDQKFFMRGYGPGKGERIGLTEEQKAEMVARHAEMKANHEVMLAAIEAGDYNAWKEAAGDMPATEQINAENFDKFVEMHNAMQNKDFETAKTLREELGLQGFHQGHMMGKMHRGMGAGMKFMDKNGDGVCDFMEQIQE